MNWYEIYSYFDYVVPQTKINNNNSEQIITNMHIPFYSTDYMLKQC